MFKIFSLLLLSLYLNASSLVLQQGDINAQTDVTLKGLIDIKTSDLSSTITMDESMNSIRGYVSLKSFSLKSDDKDRDVNMYELLQSKLHPFISFKFKEIEKLDNKFIIKGTLFLNGLNRDIESTAHIVDNDSKLMINGKFSILLTDFNMEPPSILFLDVRNKIDVDYNLNYKKD